MNERMIKRVIDLGEYFCPKESSLVTYFLQGCIVERISKGRDSLGDFDNILRERFKAVLAIMRIFGADNESFLNEKEWIL